MEPEQSRFGCEVWDVQWDHISEGGGQGYVWVESPHMDGFQWLSEVDSFKAIQGHPCGVSLMDDHQSRRWPRCANDPVLFENPPQQIISLATFGRLMERCRSSCDDPTTDVEDGRLTKRTTVLSNDCTPVWI